MIWLDELWLEPTKEGLDKIELEMGVDYFMEEKLTVTVKGDNISLYFQDGPKETYQLSDFGLDKLEREELLKEINKRIGKENIEKVLILGGTGTFKNIMTE